MDFYSFYHIYVFTKPKRENEPKMLKNHQTNLLSDLMFLSEDLLLISFRYREF